MRACSDSDRQLPDGAVCSCRYPWVVRAAWTVVNARIHSRLLLRLLRCVWVAELTEAMPHMMPVTSTMHGTPVPVQ